MADPKLEEFCRAHYFKPSFLRDMQRYCRDVIQPLLEERDRLAEEVATLKQQASTVAESDLTIPPKRTGRQHVVVPT